MSDRYRRDALGFTDEGCNFAVPGQEVQLSSVPSDVLIWGELFIDAAGGSNFKFHCGTDFRQAKIALEKFASIIQQRIDTAKECPFYEQDK